MIWPFESGTSSDPSSAGVVQRDGSDLVVRRRRYPIAWIRRITSERRSPAFVIPVVGLLLAVVAIPVFHSVASPSVEMGVALFVYAMSGLTFLCAAIWMVSAGDTYSLVLWVGQRPVRALKSDDAHDVAVAREQAMRLVEQDRLERMNPGRMTPSLKDELMARGPEGPAHT